MNIIGKLNSVKQNSFIVGINFFLYWVYLSFPISYMQFGWLEKYVPFVPLMLACISF